MDGAIHRRAGKECSRSAARERLQDRSAKLTKGYMLPAKYVIHTVGPVYRNGDASVKSQLASCYRTSLALAAQHGVETIAFPGISTGVYGYPQREAADIAVAQVALWLAEHALPKRVVLCTYDALATVIMTEALAAAA